MKQSLLLLLLFCAFSCSKNENDCTEITLGEEIILAHDTQICIDDVEYTFKADDQRCCCGCVCVWEGEFILNFEDTDGDVVYTFHESESTPNGIPPFGESVRIMLIDTETLCGDQEVVDEVRFTLLFN